MEERTTVEKTGDRMSATHCLRGIIHCHSRFSYDSMIPISAYLRFAKQHSLDFVILTDHDTMAGSLALQEAAARHLPSLQVPLAAEYFTSEGDVIAAFLQREIVGRDFARFKTEARQQGALLLLPHPFVAHASPETLAGECDVIEVFNSRASGDANQRALDLATKYKKPGFYGPDAHLSRSLHKAIIEVEDCGGLRNSLLKGRLRCTSEEPTSKWEIGASQLIKAVKSRDPYLATRVLRGGLRAAFRRSWASQSPQDIH